MQEYTVEIDTNGNKYWYQNGKLHREDGPAIEFSSGYKAWYKNGKLHREDGPAIEFSSGYKAWYKNGKWHREDGPAIERPDGNKYWYLDNVKYTEQEFLAKTQGKELTVAELEKLLGFKVKIVK